MYDLDGTLKNNIQYTRGDIIKLSLSALLVKIMGNINLYISLQEIYLYSP